MNISLNMEDEAIVERMVASGRFTSKDAVLKAALRILQEDMDEAESLRTEVEKGLDALSHGDFREYDADGLKSLAAEVKARGRASLKRADNTQS